MLPSYIEPNRTTVYEIRLEVTHLILLILGMSILIFKSDLNSLR